RRCWSRLTSLLFTQRTVRLVRQARKGFGLAGVVALGLDGSAWPCGHLTVWTWPEVGQHEAQPKQDNDDQLIVHEVWYHGVPLSHSGERGPFYPVFERSELSAVVRDTTPCRYPTGVWTIQGTRPLDRNREKD